MAASNNLWHCLEFSTVPAPYLFLTDAPAVLSTGRPPHGRHQSEDKLAEVALSRHLNLSVRSDQLCQSFGTSPPLPPPPPPLSAGEAGLTDRLVRAGFHLCSTGPALFWQRRTNMKTGKGRPEAGHLENPAQHYVLHKCLGTSTRRQTVSLRASVNHEQVPPPTWLFIICLF